MPSTAILIGSVSLAVWVYLTFARGGFWRVGAFDDDGSAKHEELDSWPSVVAVVPARNEAPTIARTLASLLSQDYPGKFSIVIVDDHSEDHTADIAHQQVRECAAEARVKIQPASTLSPGWTGKLWAMNEGVAHAGTAPEYFWFTDADIIHAPDTLRRVTARAECDNLDLTSLMVLLQARTLAERALIPAFLFFFLKLYPPRWIADPRARTAGAAGGCILLRRGALDRIGGLAAIRGEVVDDCALARAVKRRGGRLWMGLTRASVSLRSYQGLDEIRDMIARTAFTQLRYSPLLLAATIAAMFLIYIAPVALLFAHASAARAVGLVIWLLMSLLFLPTVRFYRLSPLWAPLLPFASLFYSYATLLSAVRYWRGHGALWKGRAQAPNA